MSTCNFNSDCSRSNYCDNGICIHDDIFYHNDPVTIAALCCFSPLLGFFCAGNFGSGAVQVFLLIGWMNYSQKETSGISQSVLAGITLAVWIRNQGKKHPLRNSPLIDYPLATLLLPPLLGSYIAGIYLRYFVPVFFISLFLCLQLSLAITSTFMKIKALKKLENTYDAVQQELKEQEQNIQIVTIDNNDNPSIQPQQGSTSHFDAISIQFDHDHIEINYDQIFQNISKSKDCQLYLDNLPQELRQMEIFDPNQNKMIQVEDLLKQNSQQNLNKDTEIQGEQIQQNLQENQNTSSITVNQSYVYPKPYYEITIMIVVIFLNIMNFLFRGGSTLPSIINIQQCSQTFWALFWIQIFANHIILIPIFFIQKYRYHEQYKDKVFDPQYEKVKQINKTEDIEMIKLNNDSFVQQINNSEQPQIQSQNDKKYQHQNQPDDELLKENCEENNINKSIVIEVIKNNENQTKEIQQLQNHEQVVQNKQEIKPIENQNNEQNQQIYKQQQQIEQQQQYQQQQQQQQQQQINQQIPDGVKLKNEQIQDLQSQQNNKIPRINFPYNFKAFLYFIIYGSFCGLLIGFIGLGSSLIMLVLLVQLRLNMQSIMATLPMIIFFVCVLGIQNNTMTNQFFLGSLIQIVQGSLIWYQSIFFFFLSFFGNYIFVPLFLDIFNKFKILTSVVKCALGLYLPINIFLITQIGFQVILLVVYLIIWIPQIKNNIQKQWMVSQNHIC